MFKKPIKHDVELTVKLDDESIEKINATAEVYQKAFTKATVTMIASLAAARLLEIYLMNKHKN